MRALLKASRKQLKVILALEVRKLDLAFVALNLDKFLFFNNFSLFYFSNLDNFWDLANF